MTGPPADAGKAKEKEKKRALPSEFERQVEQIRTDMKTVRENLNAAERVLAESSSRAITPSAGAPAASTAAPLPHFAPAPGQSGDSLLAPPPPGSGDPLMPDAPSGGLQ